MYRTAAALVAIGVVVAGCAGSSGGDTTCNDFNLLSNDARGAAIAKMLKERNGRNPSTQDVESRIESTLRSCASDADKDKTVADVN